MTLFTKLIFLTLSVFASLSIGARSTAVAGKVTCRMDNKLGTKTDISNEFAALFFQQSYEKPVRCVSEDSNGWNKEPVLLFYRGGGLTAKVVAVR